MGLAEDKAALEVMNEYSQPNNVEIRGVKYTFIPSESKKITKFTINGRNVPFFQKDDEFWIGSLDKCPYCDISVESLNQLDCHISLRHATYGIS